MSCGGARESVARQEPKSPGSTAFATEFIMPATEGLNSPAQPSFPLNRPSREAGNPASRNPATIEIFISTEMPLFK